MKDKLWVCGVNTRALIRDKIWLKKMCNFLDYYARNFIDVAPVWIKDN